MKAQRQHCIAGLLHEHAVANQAALVELLASAGYEATQATVSRDLDELGAVKVRIAGGESVYAIPELPHEQKVPDDHMRRVFSDWVVGVASNEPMIVLRTPPGSAHVVASAIDRAGHPEVMGTVAGDDTILLVAAPGIVAAELADEFRDLAGLAPPPRPA